MIETNRIEFKRELTRELDIEKEVVAFLKWLSHLDQECNVSCVNIPKITLSLETTMSA